MGIGNIQFYILDDAGAVLTTYPTTLPKQQTTDLSPLERATEIIREKLYRRLNRELPYNIVQETRGWTDLPDGTLRIDQTIFVQRQSQVVSIVVCLFFDIFRTYSFFFCSFFSLVVYVVDPNKPLLIPLPRLLAGNRCGTQRRRYPCYFEPRRI